MVRSMTGFGRAKLTIDGLDVTVEIKSVNHRYFEFTSRLPRGCNFLEEKLKISKKECESLEGVVSQYDTYLDTHFQMDVLECLKEKLQEKQLQAIIDNSQKKYQKINDQLNFVQQKLTQLNQDEETYQERYRRLDESLRENETYNLKNELQKESEQLKKEKEKKENSYQTLITEIKQEIQLLKKVKIPNSYIQILQNQDYQTETLKNWNPIGK